MHKMTMPMLGTAQAWRDAARSLLAAGVPPAQVSWGDATSPAGLWDMTPPPADTPSALRVPRSFITLANSVVWHSDPSRFGRLYQVLWRLRETPHLLRDRADPEVSALRRMEKNVHRCQHKMKAFVRFREVGAPDDPRRSFAAWFEPTHYTVEPTARFFADRFGDMDWRIITPDVSAFFINGDLSFGEGQSKPPLPEDANEQLWTTYFRNIFNPARLNVQAMQSEMPKKYWKNMPEAAAISDLIATAPARARAMNDAAPTIPPLRAAKAQKQLAAHATAWAGSPARLDRAIAACQNCALHCNATQAVLGTGPQDAKLMIVGEQPGDPEDLAGRPFVGPAGRLLDDMMRDAGLTREDLYLTYAVKHFKFIARGRQRIEQRPTDAEVRDCKTWLEAERAALTPKGILALGATAALALTGNADDLSHRRGTASTLADGTALVLTFHPADILRLRDPVKRREAETFLRRDLALAHHLSTAARPTDGPPDRAPQRS